MHNASKDYATPLPLRPAATVMRMERMGAFHQTRISFVRTLIRRVMREEWQIECTCFDLDERGYGDCIYTIRTGTGEIYTLVLFAQFLDDSRRSDRVIADAWDVAFALCQGKMGEADLATLRLNLPKQEAGRCTAKVLVISRANKSVRNFSYFVDSLAQGQQPDPAILAQVGYLYRTTAVYGNGKFGLADYAKLLQSDPFALPFSAQMFTVYLLRDFSIRQVNHLAQRRNPTGAVKLDERLARYVGVGNATGLGMAPFLIHHPKLINQWMLMRETALARAVAQREIGPALVARFGELVVRAQIHVSEITTDDARQQAKNEVMLDELGQLADWITNVPHSAINRTMLWQRLTNHAEEEWSVETQEMITSLLLELYPELVNELEEQMGVVEEYELIPQMTLEELKQLIEEKYKWALDFDFDDPREQHFFWYRSAEKEEPRLGVRADEPGSEKEMPITIARDVRHCYEAVCQSLQAHPNARVIEFAFRQPRLRGTIRRIQSMAQTAYGEIQDNVLSAECLPIYLLRCKLSFFGASKFDPKSALWVRITLFQGAPLLNEIGQHFADDWFLPTMPTLDSALEIIGK